MRSASCATLSAGFSAPPRGRVSHRARDRPRPCRRRQLARRSHTARASSQQSARRPIHPQHAIHYSHSHRRPVGTRRFSSSSQCCTTMTEGAAPPASSTSHVPRHGHSSLRPLGGPTPTSRPYNRATFGLRARLRSRRLRYYGADWREGWAGSIDAEIRSPILFYRSPSMRLRSREATVGAKPFSLIA